jgi:D-alanine-D-alanine ligase
MKKIRIALVFGGRSGEHEVSLTSARSFIEALDPERFQIIPVGITKQGRWLAGPRILEELENRADFLPKGRPDPPPADVTSATPLPEPVGGTANPPRPFAEADVVFNLIHGTYGEDGCLQGLFELADLPYVGAGVLGSALAMDKLAAKAVLAASGLPVGPYLGLTRAELETNPEEARGRIEARIEYPLFVKPANLGSSVGVTKVHDQSELAAALELAASFDRRIIVEQAVEGREIECAVLGNDDPEASVPGEILPAREFYDYDAKYVEDSELLIPAPLTTAQAAEVRRLAVAAFKALDVAGMARVDLFLERATDRLLINEVNTIPGFTPISMYPKLWVASGLSYNDLVARLVELALERHRDRHRTRRSYDGGGPKGKEKP